jgi:uncharacterized protein (TIGR00369 family)
MNDVPLPSPADLHTDPPSGFRQLVGYRIADWSEGAARLTLNIGPRHLNRSDVVHGGVLATVMDAAGGHAGCYCPYPGRVRRSVTVSLTANFIAPATSGAISARSYVRGGGKHIFVASIEVHDAKGTLLAVGEGVYRYRAGCDGPEGVPYTPSKLPGPTRAE